jgi:hypothetical protein
MWRMTTGPGRHIWGDWGALAFLSIHVIGTPITLMQPLFPLAGYTSH